MRALSWPSSYVLLDPHFDFLLEHDGLHGGSEVRRELVEEGRGAAKETTSRY